MALFTLLVSASIHFAYSQPAYIYDNSYGTVLISGAENDGTQYFNWTLKYPLGVKQTYPNVGTLQSDYLDCIHTYTQFLCEDPNWIKTLLIDMTATTAQADLVLAFGTNTQYFAAAIPYDGGMRIPLQAYKNGVWTNTGINAWGNYDAYSGLSVCPQPGSDLYTATTTLEQQYATDTDFRRSLIPSGDAWEWHHLVPYDSSMYGGPIAQNTDLLILTIFGDRVTDTTILNITKNGLSMTTEMTSTWPVRQSEDLFLFMGMDAAVGQKEIFETAPTTTPPTPEPSPSPTPSPTAVPSISPTKSTNAPTEGTSVPTLVPSKIPTPSPSKVPSPSPSKYPTVVPSEIPSNEPTQGQTSQPSTSMSTAQPTGSTIVRTPTTSPTDGEVKDGDSGNLVNQATSEENRLYLYIGAGVIALILLAIIIACATCYLKKKTMQKHVTNMGYDDW